MSTLPSDIATSGDRRSFSFVGLATVLAAVLANMLVYSLADFFVNYRPAFTVLTNAVPAVIFTAVPALVAVLLYRWLLRHSQAPVRTFRVIAVAVLLVSFIPDLLYVPRVDGSTAGQIAVLMLMHVVAAWVIVGMLTRLAPPSTR